jgi:hypothetical protein
MLAVVVVAAVLRATTPEAYRPEVGRVVLLSGSFISALVYHSVLR